jgi:carbonic anhydrase/acetyltransferase-like protein (isoleucine patch superfamily)
VSFNQLLVDQPQPEIAGSAVVLGEVHVGAGAILACVKQRDRFRDRSILDGFPANLVGTLTDPPSLPGWALPPDAVATLRRVQR